MTPETVSETASKKRCPMVMDLTPPQHRTHLRFFNKPYLMRAPHLWSLSPQGWFRDGSFFPENLDFWSSRSRNHKAEADCQVKAAQRWTVSPRRLFFVPQFLGAARQTSKPRRQKRYVLRLAKLIFGACDQTASLNFGQSPLQRFSLNRFWPRVNICLPGEGGPISFYPRRNPSQFHGTLGLGK